MFGTVFQRQYFYVISALSNYEYHEGTQRLWWSHISDGTVSLILSIPQGIQHMTPLGVPLGQKWAFTEWVIKSCLAYIPPNPILVSNSFIYNKWVCGLATPLKAVYKILCYCNVVFVWQGSLWWHTADFMMLLWWQLSCELCWECSPWTDMWIMISLCLVKFEILAPVQP